jgi:hypothetical protein
MICKCGHFIEKHYILHSEVLPDFCRGCWDDAIGGSYHKFVSDNLKYLERKYESNLQKLL